jgi:hypothetical protein
VRSKIVAVLQGLALREYGGTRVTAPLLRRLKFRVKKLHSTTRFNYFLSVEFE